MNNVCTFALGTTGQQLRLYATIWSATQLSTVWSSAIGVMEPWTLANHANYAVGMTEIGQTGVYQFSFPPSLQNIGETYDVIVWRRATNGATPSQTDEKVGQGTHVFTAGKVEQIQVSTA